jgi:hypothetical protein
MSEICQVKVVLRVKFKEQNFTIVRNLLICKNMTQQGSVQSREPVKYSRLVVHHLVLVLKITWLL